MSALDELLAAYADRHAAARAFKAGGGQVVGYIGSDCPEELIIAAGMLPVRLAAETGADDSIADRYGEGGGNAVIRAFVARLMDGTYAYLDHLVVSTTPSYLGALFTFLREIQARDAAFPRLPLQLFDFHHTDRPATEAFNRRSVEALKAQLEHWAGRAIKAEDLAAAIALCNDSRRLLAEMQDLRRGGRVSGPQALALTGGAYWSDKAWHNVRLAAALDELGNGPVLPGRPVVYSGSETETLDLYAALEAEGLRIVADDQGWGSRVAERLVDESGAPLDAIARRYRLMAPGPAKSSTQARVDYLCDLVEQSSAEAVVFSIRGLDHPAAWDQPAQAAALKARGVEVIVLPPETHLAPAKVKEAVHG